MTIGHADIPWTELETFYGNASKVPALLQLLRSRKDETQLAALDELSNLICHQADHCETTPYCVPFLLELVRTRSTRNRDRLLGLLLTIAVGLDSDELASQETILTGLEELNSRLKEPVNRRTRFRHRQAQIYLDCYDSVRKGVPDFVRFLDDRNLRLRIQAAYTLAWFPAHVRKTLPRLREKMRTSRRSHELANAIVSVGLLEFQASVSRTSRKFVRPFLDDKRELLRYAAAIYLFRDDPSERVIEILRCLSIDHDFDDAAVLPFNNYGWTEFADNLLDRD